MENEREWVDPQALTAFLLRAGARTYAGAGAETKPSRPASHDLRHEEGEWLYLDTYLGGERFAGEEAVWKGGLPLWSMNYCGRTLSPRFSGDFLKEALGKRPAEAPFRGPTLHRRGAYTYHNSVEGSLEWFQGKEEIFFEDEKVYECVYHGGRIRR